MLFKHKHAFGLLSLAISLDSLLIITNSLLINKANHLAATLKNEDIKKVKLFD